MLDAVNFEDRGKPAAVVATTNFVRLATSIARANHLDELPLVTIPHPLGNPPKPVTALGRLPRRWLRR